MKPARITAAGQIRIYFGKCARQFIRERQWKYLLSSFLIILLISLVTGPGFFVTWEDTEKGAFAVISACIWSGIFHSIRSVCRERAIVKREHRTGLRLSSYVLAHVLYETALCSAEALIILITLVIRNNTHLPDSGLIFPMAADLYITLFLVTLSADLLALLISCAVREENAAMMVMPFLLVIQLIMSGVVFSLSGIAEKISVLTVSRWGVDGIRAIARTDPAVDMKAALLGAESSTPEASTLLRVWLILLLFCLIDTALCIPVLRLADRDRR